MKKMYLILVSIFLTGLLTGQTYLSEDFSSGQMPPDGWNALPLSSGWGISSTSNAGGTAPECKFEGFSATSTARLMSPGVDMTSTDTAILMFKHKYIKAGTGVSIGAAIKDGTAWIPVWELSPMNNIDAEEITIMLTGDQIASSSFKFSFYVSGSLAAVDNWYIDDIVLFTPIEFDAKMAGILTPETITQPSPIIGSIMNLGSTVISEASVSWVSYSGIVHDSTFVNLDLGLLESVDLNFDGSWVSPPGPHNLEMWINSVNGAQDMNPDNDTLVKSINFQSVSFSSLPVFEEFTSSTCAPCASFNSGFVPWTIQNADDIVLVKYQMNWPGSGDPYYTAEGGTRRNYYGVNAVPDLFAQGDHIGASVGAATAALNAAQGQTSFYKVASDFTISGTNITIETNILPFTNASARVHNVVIEKVTTGNIASNGETEFHHVMMKMMPSANGASETFISGQPNQLTYTYDLSSTNVEEYDDLLVVVMIQDYATKEIFQSSYGIEDANYSNEARLSELTLDGQLVEGFDPDVFEYDVVLPVGTAEEPVLNGVTMNDGALMIINMAFAIPGTASIKVFAENLIDFNEYFINYSYDYVGEGETVKDLISIYPNPAHDKLYITGLQNSDVSLLTTSGRVILQKNNFSGSEIDLSNLSRGMYIVSIKLSDGQSVRKKIMVL